MTGGSLVITLPVHVIGAGITGTGSIKCSGNSGKIKTGKRLFHDSIHILGDAFPVARLDLERASTLERGFAVAWK
jgi:hypothetical protein